MKHAVSISIGSSTRDKTVEIELFGQPVCLKRIGTDGDMEKAAQLYKEMDGQVDAFGVGGADLGLMVDRRWYPLYSIQPIVRYVRRTPLLDGTGLKITLERRVAPLLDGPLSRFVKNKRVLIAAGVDRWGLSQAFLSSGYECVFGDLMFGLGLPIPLRSARSLKRLAAVLMPVAGRLPFKWIYPVGEAQEKRTPKWQRYFDWADVIAGDCHYIRRYMPSRLPGKVIVTNTTTAADVQLFRETGVTCLVTTTPVLDGRSFGTNMMEAGIVAAKGWNTPVNYADAWSYFAKLDSAIDQLKLIPQIQELS